MQNLMIAYYTLPITTKTTTLPKAFLAWLLDTNSSILMETKPKILLQFLISIKIFYS